MPAATVERARARADAASNADEELVLDRRGPLRPAQLTPSRARLHGRALTLGFKLVDSLVLGGYALTAITVQAEPSWAHSTCAALFCIVTLWALVSMRGYAFRAGEALVTHLARVVAAFVITGLVIGAVMVASADRLADLPLIWFGAGAVSILMLHVFAWMLVRDARAKGRLTANIVIVGAGANAERLVGAALKAGDVSILGIFDDRAARAPRAILGVPVLGDTQALLESKILPFVDRIVVAVPEEAEARVREIIDRLSVLPNPVALLVDGAGRGVGVASLSGASLAHVSGKRDDVARAFVKRAQDVIVGSIALLVALPIMAATALAVRLDSPGPILFRQKRHGFNNEEIVVWKFRSMKAEASDATASRQISSDDDRVTRVGRFIRSTSLDELPQIFNVLKGEMSLVGPRPHAIGMKTGEVESARLVAHYAHRHRMKPGMTGWAAIHGSRGPVDTPQLVRERVALDVEYIERQSFWLDLYIIAMTIPCLLGDRQAVR
jgi:Undecaprenyl-phosphate glucose phosphotransferase